MRKKIVEYFKNNVCQCQIAKALQISSSTVHNIIKRFRETEISVCKGQGRRPLLDARGLQALRWHCITRRHDSAIDITKWAQEYFQKPMSVNTIRCAICRCQLKLYHSKRKPYVNMVQMRCCVLWAKAHLKWNVSKWKSVLWSDESKFDILVGNHGWFWKALWMLKGIIKVLRATYAPLQTMCISAGQCKTTYCSYNNSMVS